jgi:hypothetical protein
MSEGSRNRSFSQGRGGGVPGRQEKKEKNGKRKDRKTRRGGGGRGIWDK